MQREAGITVIKRDGDLLLDPLRRRPRRTWRGPRPCASSHVLAAHVDEREAFDALAIASRSVSLGSNSVSGSKARPWALPWSLPRRAITRLRRPEFKLQAHDLIAHLYRGPGPEGAARVEAAQARARDRSRQELENGALRAGGGSLCELRRLQVWLSRKSLQLPRRSGRRRPGSRRSGRSNRQ